MGVPPFPVAPGVSGPRLCKGYGQWARWSQVEQKRDPNLEPGLCHLLPASLPLPFPQASVTFDLLITSLWWVHLGAARGNEFSGQQGPHALLLG